MDDFKRIFIKRPHVVILGAGATVDAFPDGDKRGKHSALSTTRESYELYDDFYVSSLAKAPRRSVECYFKRYIGGWWGTPKISLVKDMSFKTLQKELKPLLVNEILNNYSEI